MTIPCIAIVNKILCHRYRSCEFSRVKKQYAIRKNDLSKKEKMLQTNRQTLRKNNTSFSFRGQSRVHAKQCIGRAANHYSCLTYTAWVETLYTSIGRTAILFFPCIFEAFQLYNPLLNITYTEILFIEKKILFYNDNSKKYQESRKNLHTSRHRITKL